MADNEYVSNLGTWFFRALIESSKLDRMTRNEEAAHQNKPRLNLQFESTYDDDDAYVTVNRFESEQNCLLFGARAAGPPELTGLSVVTLPIPYPTGPGLPPFLRAPVLVCSTVGFYIPDAPSANAWASMDLAGAVDLTGRDNWLLSGIGPPNAQAQNFRSGAVFALRTAGFANFLTPTPAATFPANAWVYVFFQIAGAVSYF